MKKKTILISAIIILYIIFGSFISSNPTLGIILGTIAFFLFSYFSNKLYLKNTNRILICTLIATHIFFVLLLIIVKGTERFLLGGNIYIIVYLVSIYLGYVFYKSNIIYKFICIVIFGLFNYITCLYLPTIISQYDFYGTMTGEVNYNIPSNNLYVLNGRTSDTLNLNDLNDKIVVLDFWNNNCGICFQKFPQLKKLKEKYKNNDNISFYAINAYKSKEEIKIGQQLFDSLDNGINTYFLSKDKSESLRIQGFPTVLVIKNNKVIFRGSIEALSIFDKFYLK